MITRDEADRSIEVHVSGCRRAETCWRPWERFPASYASLTPQFLRKRSCGPFTNGRAPGSVDAARFFVMTLRE